MIEVKPTYLPYSRKGMLRKLGLDPDKDHLPLSHKGILEKLERSKPILPKAERKPEPKQKVSGAKAEQDLYTAKARLLAAIFNPRWFPEQYKNGIHEIDHQFSIAAGFHKKVPLYVIGNRGNLRPVLIADNRAKRGSCSITLKALVESARYDDDYLRMSRIIDAVPTVAKLRRWYAIYRQWHDGRLAALSLEDPTFA